ncbi:MAG TPA: hypothetical protein VF848_04730 [Steroidobacteraceae bacterium]
MRRGRVQLDNPSSTRAVRSWHYLAMATLATVLTACGGSGKPAASQVAGAAKPAVAEAPIDPDEADMVSAVSNANSTTPLTLKFRIGEQPRNGSPVHVELAVVPDPAVDIDALHIAMQVSDGLKLDSPSQVSYAEPARGRNQHFEVLVHPTKPGVLSLFVTVLVDTADASLTRNYTVPLIVLDSSR